MKRNEGFTVTELMVAVVIIGVLASIAIPGFSSYIYKARVTEATNFLGKIKQRQESYRNEFGQYCAVDGADWGSWNPATIPGIDPVGWQATNEWNQLGASPDGPIRFRYATIAGFPGVAGPTDSIDINPNDHWFLARAEGDLNEDTVTFYVEISSQSDRIYNSAIGKGGWE
jgi:prepilin-type N-terminal cleavage/methylation domain-containing protein